MSDRELRDLLRRGDPANDGSEPDPAERARLRAAVLDADKGNPSTRPLPALLLPAGAVITALLVLGLSWVVLRDRYPAEPAPGTGREAVPASPIAEADDLPAAPLPGEPAPRLETESPLPAAVPPAPAQETATTDDDTPRGPRTVRFTAAGGTRIIWTLDPEFDI